MRHACSRCLTRAASLGALVPLLALGCAARHAGMGGSVHRVGAIRPAGARAETLEAVAQLPEHELDLTRALALLAREQDPALALGEVASLIESRARAVRRRLGPAAGAERVVRVMNRLVLGGLRPYAENVLANSPADLNVSHVVKTGRGTCISFAAIYLAVAQRAGLPFRAAYTRKHLFVRYEDGRSRRNVETVSGGRKITDAQYVRHFKLHPQAVSQGIVLRSLTRREFLSHVLSAYGAALATTAPDRAGRFLQLAVQADPDNPVALHNLAGYANRQGDRETARRLLDTALAANPFLLDAYLARSHLLRSEGRFEAALADATAAVRLEPTSAAARLARAELYGLLGNLASAAQDCRAVLASDRTEHRALYLLARVHALGGHSEQALDLLERAIRHGAADLPQMRRLRDFESLRASARFRRLVGPP